MTLTNRLTLFALGVVLAAFSGTTNVLVRTYLIRESNDQATATRDTLVAAEVEEDGLEWERRNQQILLRGDGEPPAWTVSAASGWASQSPLGSSPRSGPDRGRRSPRRQSLLQISATELSHGGLE